MLWDLAYKARNFVTSSVQDEAGCEIYDGDTLFGVDGPDGTVYYGKSDAIHLAKLE